MTSLISVTNSSTIQKRLRVGLFIPCYIDMIFPEVGIATLQLLERFGSMCISRSTRLAADSLCRTAGMRPMPQLPRTSLLRTLEAMTTSSARQVAASNRSDAISIPSNRQMMLGTFGNIRMS